MSNKLLTIEEVTTGMLKLIRKQIKLMKKDGLSDKEISAVISAQFAGLWYGPIL